MTGRFRRPCDTRSAGLVGGALDIGVGDAGGFPADQSRHQYEAAAGGEAVGEGGLLRGLAGVGEDDHAGYGIAGGFEEQTFGVHAFEHRPADGEDLVGGCGEHFGRSHRAIEPQAVVDNADNAAEPVAVRGSGAAVDRGGGLAVQVAVHSGQHAGGEVAVERERAGSGGTISAARPAARVVGGDGA